MFHIDTASFITESVNGFYKNRTDYMEDNIICVESIDCHKNIFRSNLLIKEHSFSSSNPLI